jgi:CelD/BcsL family acetyltransferase involved in cellulose biosynthesis
VRLVILREIPEDQNLRKQWNTLLGEMECPQIFYTYEWAMAVQRAYGRLLVPLLMLAYEGESLVGLAALATNQAQKVCFLTATTADYCDFISHPRRRPELIEALFAHLQELEVRFLELANLPADSASARAIRSSSRTHGFFQFSRAAYACAQVVLGTKEHRLALKDSLLRKKMLRRSISALQRHSPVSLSHLGTWDRVQDVLPGFFRAHVARFLATGRISNLVQSDRRVFLTELAKLLSESGSLTLTRLLLGEQPVAWNYGFQFAQSWFWYLPTFDNDLEQYSPGFCLLSRMIAEACNSPEIDVVDLGLGAEGYKDRFATATRRTLHLTMTTSLRRYLKAVAQYRVAQAAGLTPRVEHGIRYFVTQYKKKRDLIRKKKHSGFLAWTAKRVSMNFFDREEVLFYQVSSLEISKTIQNSWFATRLKNLDLNLLSGAAMANANDPETLDYLLRCANRLRTGNGQGFALVNAESLAVHFCWVASFDGFYMAELNFTLAGASTDAVMLFDCWTPASQRGRSYYGAAIQLVAEHFECQEKGVWIFSATGNRSSIRGIEKLGLPCQFSLSRRKFLLWERVSRVEFATVPMTAQEVSVA